MSFLGRGTHITRDMCFPRRKTHITRDMFFLRVLTTNMGSYKTNGLTTRVSYNQGFLQPGASSYNQGFLQPGVLKPGVFATGGSYNQAGF